MIPFNAHNAHTVSYQGLTILHYSVGTVFFLLLTVLLYLSRDALSGHYFHPKLLAITHIAVLGWAVMVIFGAIYQFLPVISNAALFSKKLAVLSFVLLCSGTLMLAHSFWFFTVGFEMQLAGVLVFTSFLLFSINVNITLKTAEKWSIATDFIQASSIWLIVTAVIGLLMVFNFRYPFLPASHLEYLQVHAHAGIIGWFLLLIIGVASRLLPMFLLSHPPSETKLKISYWCINIGLLTYIIDQLLLSIHVPAVHLIIISAGIICFLLFSKNLVKNRLRKSLDWPMKQSIVALILLIVPILLACLLISGLPLSEKEILRLTIGYGIAVFIGFISALIIGQTFKTLPFIVWMYAYKSRGQEVRLLPKDLYSEKSVFFMQCVFVPASALLILGVVFDVGIMIHLGTLSLIVAALIYCINVGKVLLHIVKPTEHGINYHVTS